MNWEGSAMKSRILGLVAVGLLAGGADANAINITADGFAPGTNITNAFDHATVTNYLGEPTFAAESWLCSPTVSELCSDRLGLAIGRYPDRGAYDWAGVIAGDALEAAGHLIPLDEVNNWAGAAYWRTTFRVDFDVAIGHVRVWTYDSEALHQLLAFDKDGNLIGSVGESFIELLTCDWHSPNCPEPGQMIYWVLDYTAPHGSSIWTITVNGQDSFGIDKAVATVPEPGTLALFSLGLAGLRFTKRRKAH
jgi:hypothetical protein